MPNTVGVDFAEAAASSLAEQGAFDDLEAKDIADNEASVEPDGNNQPESDPETDGVLAELVEQNDNSDTNPDGSAAYDVPGVGRVSVEDLIAGYMKDADYTQKTQELAKQREENAQAIKLFELIQEDPRNTLPQLMRAAGMDAGSIGQRNDAWRRVDALAGNDVKNGLDFSNAELDDLTVQKQVNEAVRAALQEDPSLRQVREQALRAKVDGAFEQLEADEGVKFSETDRRLILQKAADEQSTNLRYAFYLLKQDLEAKRADRDRLKESGSQSGSRSAPDGEGAEATVDAVPKGFGEAIEMAVRDLQISDLANY